MDLNNRESFLKSQLIFKKIFTKKLVRISPKQIEKENAGSNEQPVKLSAATIVQQ